MLIRLFAILLLLPCAVMAAPWAIDPESTISVDVKWSGGTVEVKFPSFSGTIDFDETRPGDARAKIAVAATQATTGLPPADLLLRSTGYLETARFPTITFQLDSLTQTSKSTATIEGRITLRGATRPISFQAEVIRYRTMPDDPSRFEAGFNLTATIDRTNFGSNAGIPDVATVLPVRIKLLMHSI